MITIYLDFDGVLVTKFSEATAFDPVYVVTYILQGISFFVGITLYLINSRFTVSII